MAFPCTDDPHHRTHLALADVDGHLGHPDGCFRHVVPVNPPGTSHGEKLRSLLRSDPGRRCPGLPVTRNQNGVIVARCTRCAIGFVVRKDSADGVRVAMGAHQDWVGNDQNLGFHAGSVFRGETN